MKQVEICTSGEWFRLYSSLDLPDEENDEVPDLYFQVALETLEDDVRASDLKIIPAMRQRMFCHGWNGAKFTFRYDGIGSFDELTPNEKDVIAYAAMKAGAVVESLSNCH